MTSTGPHCRLATEGVSGCDYARHETNSPCSSRVPQWNSAQPAVPPSSSRKEIFTTTWNWVTWLFSTTPSNSLTHTDWILRIVLEARSTVCRTASAKLSEDRPDSSMNFTTDIIPSLDH